MGKFSKAAEKLQDGETEAPETKAEKVKAPAKKKAAGKAKATKPAKGGKAKAKAKAPAKKEATERAPDTRKIKLLTKENPKREGSASYDRFAIYKNGMKVQEFFDAGGTAADLRYDANAGHIEVA